MTAIRCVEPCNPCTAVCTCLNIRYLNLLNSWTIKILFMTEMKLIYLWLAIVNDLSCSFLHRPMCAEYKHQHSADHQILVPECRFMKFSARQIFCDLLSLSSWYVRPRSAICHPHACIQQTEPSRQQLRLEKPVLHEITSLYVKWLFIAKIYW